MSSIKRILCAEPDGDTCELIKLLLQQEGYEVKTAGNVAESIKLATSERFDLYILNDQYFDGDGLELCRRLRELDPDTPLLLLSENSSAYDRRRGLSAGVHAYFSKPGEFDKLIQTVNMLLK